MGLLPDDINPLLKQNAYDALNQEYGIDVGPYDREEEISKALKKISLNKLSAADRTEKLESIKKLLKTLKNPSSRVRLNTFILDKVDSKTVEERFRHLPNLKTENTALPKPDLSQVIIEGESLDFADADFAEIEAIPELDMNFEEVKDILYKSQVEKHIIFEV